MMLYNCYFDYVLQDLDRNITPSVLQVKRSLY